MKTKEEYREYMRLYMRKRILTPYQAERRRQTTSEWRKRNKDKIKEHQIRYKLKHPEYLKKQKVLKREWNRKWKIRNPLHKYKDRNVPPKPDSCQICCHKSKICYDHCHLTGKFRGWICQKCNSALGFSRDNVDILNKMIQYLKK